jgi:hypothetical protein
MLQNIGFLSFCVIIVFCVCIAKSIQQKFQFGFCFNIYLIHINNNNNNTYMHIYSVASRIWFWWILIKTQLSENIVSHSNSAHDAFITEAFFCG